MLVVGCWSLVVGCCEVSLVVGCWLLGCWLLGCWFVVVVVITETSAVVVVSLLLYCCWRVVLDVVALRTKLLLFVAAVVAAAAVVMRGLLLLWVVLVLRGNMVGCCNTIGTTGAVGVLEDWLLCDCDVIALVFWVVDYCWRVSVLVTAWFWSLLVCRLLVGVGHSWLVE